MPVIIELLNSFDQSSKEYGLFLRNLLLLDNDIPFDTEEVNSVQSAMITAVNVRINQESTRCDGLVILEHMLPKCSKDVMSKYGILWIAKATQVIENMHSSQHDLTIACKVIGKLISQCKEVPEIQKQISMQNVKQLINAINALELNMKRGAVYYLIAVLLHHYPEVCERFQVVIRQMALQQIDSEQASMVIAGANCYMLLSKATERSFKAPPEKSNYTGWLYSEALICNNLHTIMDNLFSGLVEIGTVDVWDKLDLPKIVEDNVIEFYNKQKQRFLNLCTFLSIMLRGYGPKNSVLPTDVLQLLCRGLAITPKVLKNQDTVKKRMLYLMLPKLHSGLLNVLEALVTGFRQELLPWGSTILQLFQQTLQWTKNVLKDQVTISGSKPFKNVRISVYKCLSTWLIYLKSSSGIETIAEECLPYILKDIVPERDCVVLTVQKPQYFSKRALKRYRESQYEKSVSLDNTVTASKNSQFDTDLCKEALTTLQNIFFSGGIWLKQSFYKNVQDAIVPLLYNFYLNPMTQNFYNKNSECRLHLLKTLKALEMNPHSQIAAPTQYSMEVFEMALNDNDANIIQEAQLALAELEKIIHPVAPTLQLAKIDELTNGHDKNNDNEQHSVVLDETNAGESIDDEFSCSEKRRKMVSTKDSTDANNKVDVEIEDSLSESHANNLMDSENVASSLEEESSAQLQEDLPSTNNIVDNMHNGVDKITEEDCNTIEDRINTVSGEDVTANKCLIKGAETARKNDTVEVNKGDDTREDEVMEDAEQEEILRLFHDEPKDD